MLSCVGSSGVLFGWGLLIEERQNTFWRAHVGEWCIGVDPAAGGAAHVCSVVTMSDMSGCSWHVMVLVGQLPVSRLL
jgi:hypothetical protein